MKEPDEARDKILFVSIREEHNVSSLYTIRWTPGSGHLADTLLKDNPVIAANLEDVLKSESHTHEAASFTVSCHMPSHTSTK